MKLAIVTNSDWFFLSHRLPIALRAIREGNSVFLLTVDTGKRKEVESYGIHFMEIPFNRKGTNPVYEAKCVLLLLRAYKKIHPDIIHHVTIKAALLGCFAARLGGFDRVVNAISGMGYAFTDGRKGWLQCIMKMAMGIAFKKKTYTFILQNPDDVATIKRMRFVPESRVFLIKGSGVDLNLFKFTPLPHGDVLSVLFPARILRDKGVMEFINAAKLLRKQYMGKVRFVLAGDCDINNPSVLYENELKDLLEPEYIEWVGYQSNMYSLYSACDIVCLPSYREGLPKSLIEACSVGRPIVTTNVPGCRECVKDGYNGFLVPAKEVEPLEAALVRLIDDATLRECFGANSRKKAESEFSIDKVVEEHFKVYAAI